MGKRIIMGRYDFTQTKEYRKKMSTALFGEKNPRWGIKLSKELKERISESEKGRNLGKTWEEIHGIKKANKARKKLSNSQKGIKCKEETKQKIREVKLGKPLTKEHRQKISDGLHKAVKEGRKKSTKKLKSERQKLSAKIRNLYEMDKWKEAILKRDILTYPKIPRGIQIHHIKSVTNILNEYKIKTIEEAKTCNELWDIENGVCLRCGEHLIISRMEWYTRCRISIGFIKALKVFIALNEDKAIEL